MNKSVKFYTDLELAACPVGSVFVWDIECYPNYFAIGFRNIEDDKHVLFEYSPDQPLDVDKLRWFVWRYCIVGFNSSTYDIVLLTLALWNCSLEQLKEASDRIIIENWRPHKFQREYGIEIPMLNHVDLMPVAPLDASLKLYGGRLHCTYIRELPYDPNTYLTREQAADVAEYLCTDLEDTKLLLTELVPHIELRQDLSKRYGRDLRSLSDAQVAEAIVCSELHKELGYYPRRPTDVPNTGTYRTPAFMQFKTKQLQDALKIVEASHFTVEDNGAITMPEAVTSILVRFDNTVYKFGKGGLHSQEKSIAHFADSDTLLIDRDVASYYPKIVLNQGLHPKHLGIAFLEVYGSIVERRLRAKKAGSKKEAEGLKIAVNGIFGKFGSMYSAVYSPDLMLQVTISGQLCLLMLIEAIELAGIPVISGNTDGIVIKCPAGRYETLQQLIAEWEALTGFETEETRYRALYSRDVNNYIALKEKPDPKGRLLSDRLGCKVKGVYSEVGSAQNSVLSKNPETLICNDALLAYLTNGIPIEQTIRECKDIRRFVSVRTVKGGALKNGQYLGKAVRWYYAKGEAGAIHYRTTGNKVSKSDGAKPLMMLPNEFPADVNHEHYINVCREALYDIGAKKRPQSYSFF